MFHWRMLTLRDWLGILAVVVFACVWMYVLFAVAPAYVGANMGFGPEWVCKNPYNHGPVCVKKPFAPKAGDPGQ